jgi:hypothetical protein
MKDNKRFRERVWNVTMEQSGMKREERPAAKTRGWGLVVTKKEVVCTIEVAREVGGEERRCWSGHG